MRKIERQDSRLRAVVEADATPKFADHRQCTKYVCKCLRTAECQSVDILNEPMQLHTLHANTVWNEFTQHVLIQARTLRRLFGSSSPQYAKGLLELERRLLQEINKHMESWER